MAETDEERLCSGGCGRALVPDRVWHVLPAEEKAARRAIGEIGEHRRGFCATCAVYGRPPSLMSGDLLMSEYRHFYDANLNQAENCRRLGLALDMDWRTVERAVLREKARRRQETTQ